MRTFLILFAAIIFVGTLPQPLHAVRGDYDGDGKSNLVLAKVDRTARRTTWYIRNLLNTTTTSVVLRAPGDAFVPADYDGNGITDPAVVYVANSGDLEWHIWQGGQDLESTFGVNGDKPVVGDFDCDGRADKSVMRKNSLGQYYWHFELSSGATQTPFRFGKSGDYVFVGRFSSVTCDDLVLARPATEGFTWFTRPITSSTYAQVAFGQATDKPYAPADINGDGADELIMIRTIGQSRRLIVRNADTTESEVVIGGKLDVPLSGNFSGASQLEFGYYKKTTNSQKSRFSIKLVDETTKNVSFGTAINVLVRPDGSVVQPSDMGPTDCGSPIVSVDSIYGILYKPSNLHGGRGPTFLIQKISERTGRSRIAIKDMNCKTISYFGMYATDWPYGARYYQKSGGSSHSAEQLYRLANKAGSSAVLVQGKGKWIKINDPRNRQGAVSNNGPMP